MIAHSRPSEAPESTPHLVVLPPPGFNGLLHLVEEASREVHPASARYGIHANETYSVQHLVALVTYCYCSGVYSSQDVEAAAREEPVLRGMFESVPPDWKTLRRFRRAHRALLHQCLCCVLERALTIRFGGTDLALADFCVAQAMDRWFEPICVPFPDREAGERIERAVFVDGMLLD